METTEKLRRENYKLLAAHRSWPAVFADLLRYAQEAPDPTVRCGRNDMIVFIQESLIGGTDD